MMGALFAGAFLLPVCAFVILMVAAMWIIFTKAGQPGWAAIIPIYNLFVKLQIVGRPWWWMLLMIVPLVNIILWFIMSIDLARSFGKASSYGVGLALLPFIFHPMLAFGSSRYQGSRPVA